MTIAPAAPTRAPRHTVPVQANRISLPGRAPAPGRHRRPDPEGALPRRPEAETESTRGMSAVTRREHRLARPARLPRPRTAGLLIQHPDTGALAISSNARGLDYPLATTPCFAMISGRDHVFGKVWITYSEACAYGFVLVGDVHDLL